ncbi:hypothetical protein [Herbaspirillum sp.]|uniref:hypothetical protein n=1 Tax=Herbaspirillum sp. TaxID=1890675 RepID=UPI0031D1F787
MKLFFSIFLIIALWGCAAPPQIKTRPTNFTLQIKQLNIGIVTFGVEPSKNLASNVSKSNVAVSWGEKIGVSLAEAFPKNGVPAVYRPVYILPGDPIPSPNTVFPPTNSVPTYTMLIKQTKKHAVCYGGKCETFFDYRINLLAPLTNQEVWSGDFEILIHDGALFSDMRNESNVKDLTASVLAEVAKVSSLKPS